MASAAAVNAFEFEAISNRVWSSTLAGSPSLRTPKPRVAITTPSLTMAIATPGTSKACMTRLTSCARLTSEMGVAAGAA
jgi:hypothetical protein